MSDFLSRTWAEINLDHIIHNYIQIKNLLQGNAEVLAVVKADAYGHGVKFVAPALDKAGAAWFGVSNIEEALQLRAMNITKLILIFGYTPPSMAKVLAAHNISQTVLSSKYALSLSEMAKTQNVTVKIHIKIDTGMSRLGFSFHHIGRLSEVTKEIISCTHLENIQTEGIFTHFASADYDGDRDGSFTETQFALFSECIKSLQHENINIPIIHCCNSAATIFSAKMHSDLVRPGIILYGLNPSKELAGKINLLPVMELKSVVSMVKTVEAGASISYGRTFKATHQMRVATIPIGYADGYFRCLSGKADILIGGKRAKILGRICMDQMVVDVTDIEDVYEGQIVTIFGKDGTQEITIDEISALAGTINYETVCLIGKRVPRIFFQNGKQIGQINYVYEGESI